MNRIKGFTLVELMIVIAVVAVLSAMAFIGLRQAQATARDTARAQMMTGIQIALEKYYSTYQYYPAQANWGNMFTYGNVINGVTTYGICGSVSWTQGTACTSGFLSNMPKDPDGSCTRGMTNGGWSPCAADLTKPMYYYESPDGTHCNGQALPQGYQLRLIKQSGGTAYYCSPN